MASRPIFHITHLNNLDNIINHDRLWSDAQRIEQNLSCTNIGLNHIKARRMAHPVTVAAGGILGSYVPFNFCPRSVMLYVIFRGHENYAHGQEPIIHLISSICSVAQSTRPFAFTDRHADLGYANQYDCLDDLDKIDWPVMQLRYWNDTSDIREKRQAEFLVHDWLPWTAIEKIAVINQSVKETVEAALLHSTHKPNVIIQENWYY